jgi:hypothetical protein
LQKNKKPPHLHQRGDMNATGVKALLLKALLLVATPATVLGFCRPDAQCWPNETAFEQLNSTMGGVLAGVGSQAYLNASKMMYVNWMYEDGHRGSPSALPAYAVLPRTPADIQVAVQFAMKHDIQLSIKSTGHT